MSSGNSRVMWNCGLIMSSIHLQGQLRCLKLNSGLTYLQIVLYHLLKAQSRSIEPREASYKLEKVVTSSQTHHNVNMPLMPSQATIINHLHSEDKTPNQSTCRLGCPCLLYTLSGDHDHRSKPWYFYSIQLTALSLHHIDKRKARWQEPRPISRLEVHPR